ncbi:MAG: VanZ family protein [Coriobacteriales bacterium]|jgi:VanZ family protein
MYEEETYERREGPGCFSAIVAWTLVVLWAAAIYYASSRTSAYLDAGQGLLGAAYTWLASKLSSYLGRPIDPSPIGHFCEYFIFGGLITNALRHHMSLPAAAIFTVLIVAAYATTDEIHQIYVDGRSPDIHDWLVDVVASASAVGVAALFLPGGRRRRRA